MDAYIGEIRLLAYNQIPYGWMPCEGQALRARDYSILYSFISDTYGGDGTTFNLPNLAGRVPIHISSGYKLGASGGANTHSLMPQEMPNHSHALQSSTDAGTADSPSDNLPAIAPGKVSSAAPPEIGLRATAVSLSGKNEPHENRQPYTTLVYCICVEGNSPLRP